MASVKAPKLADVISDHIKQLILEGALRPGERIASERDLADKLAVSRPSLREALEMLVEKGLLTTTHGGTYVARFMAPLTEPLALLMQSNERVISDYFGFRKLIEGPAARLAAEHATAPEKKAIADCIERLKRAHKLEDPTDEAEADADLHMLIYEAGGNLVIMHVMRAFSEMLRSDVFYSRKKLYQSSEIRDVLLEQHEAIGLAIERGDGAAAETAATGHIHFTAETLERLYDEEIRLGRALRRLNRGEILG
jgi:GntR family transcriptional repressor for pyruvate dehydrogenase complex